MTRKKSAEIDAETIKRIKALWRSKRTGKSFDAFYEWYLQQDHKCCYCGITEPEIARLFEIAKRDTGKPLVKHGRGRHLEVGRKSPNGDYKDFDNLALTCYWCNNAKTDTFTETEFKSVGQVFRKIWQDRLERGKG